MYKVVYWIHHVSLQCSFCAATLFLQSQWWYFTRFPWPEDSLIFRPKALFLHFNSTIFWPTVVFHRYVADDWRTILWYLDQKGGPTWESLTFASFPYADYLLYLQWRYFTRYQWPEQNPCTVWIYYCEGIRLAWIAQPTARQKLYLVNSLGIVALCSNLCRDGTSLNFHSIHL